MQIKAEEAGHAQREEDAELRRRAEQEQLRVRQQRLEVDHRADADEQQKWEQLVADAGVKQQADDADLVAVHILLRDDAGERDVDENRAEADREQQSRLHLFGDREVNQDTADTPHHDMLPGDVEHVGKKKVHKVHGVQPFH